jgi:hypothetical protein
MPSWSTSGTGTIGRLAQQDMMCNKNFLSAYPYLVQAFAGRLSESEGEFQVNFPGSQVVGYGKHIAPVTGYPEIGNRIVDVE